MKTISGICWLFVVCTYLSEVNTSIRRPLSSPYAPMLILKNPRPINSRISMGNAIYIGSNSFHKRIPYKYTNHRIRRPVYNILSTNWKNQYPMRVGISLNNRSILSQRFPAKEFYSTNKVPEYSPEYKPELIALPETHRGSVDDDKGPIYTIPAPNLSPSDKPSIRHNMVDMGSKIGTSTIPNSEHIANYHYRTSAQNSQRTPFGLATINNSSLETTTNLILTQQNQYEVTERNDIAVKEHEMGIFQSKDLDAARLYSIIVNNPQPQSNEMFASHSFNSDTSVAGSNIQPNVPMQTNLHNSVNVEFPFTAVPQTLYTTTRQDLPMDFYVSHPAPTGPPLSDLQLYNLLNFPHKLAEQYTSGQQQFDQTLQSSAGTSFSQPKLHSFNYDEQANQRQQQQISPDQDYVSGSVITDYNLEPSVNTHKQDENTNPDRKFKYQIERAEPLENYIEYGETIQQNNPATYFNKITDDISTRFYTTLPNREAAEKLAALAAAGNVNSQLIGQLRKQQKKNEKNEAIPFNHKNDNDDIIIQHDKTAQMQIKNDQQQKYDQAKSDQNKINQNHYRQSYNIQNDELSRQITTPNKSDYVIDDEDQSDMMKVDIEDVDYEYENENENQNKEVEIEDVQ